MRSRALAAGTVALLAGTVAGSPAVQAIAPLSGSSMLSVATSSSLSVSGLPGLDIGANVLWTDSSLGSASSSGQFACGVSASVSMVDGRYNSGLAYVVDWSNSLATKDAFSSGISPASGTAIYSDPDGNAGSISFSSEIVDPVILVAFIDTGAAMDFGSNSISVLSSYSGAPATLTVVGNKVLLDGPLLDTVDDGWAVKVTGQFGPTSGPLSFTMFSSDPVGDTVAISVASSTICPLSLDLGGLDVDASSFLRSDLPDTR